MGADPCPDVPGLQPVGIPHLGTKQAVVGGGGFRNSISKEFQMVMYCQNKVSH